MKRRTKKLILSCTALLAFSTMAFGLVSISDDVTVKAANSPVTLKQTASIRLAKDANDANGIRFESTVTEENYDANAVYGTLICPADYLSTTNVLCHDDDKNGELWIYDETKATPTNANAVLDIRALPEFVEEEGLYVFRGAVTNVRDNNLARPFAARSYVGTPDGNGGYTYEYSDVYSRSIYSVATHAIAHTEKYATYKTEEQAFLDGITDKVAASVKGFTVTTDKTGEKVSTTDEVTVTANVTVDTKHYDGELDVAPLFEAKVDGETSSAVLNRVDANVYTLADLGKYTLTPYVGKTAKKTADDISLTCNMLNIFTKAGDITKDEGKLTNPYITSTSAGSWETANALVHTDAKVGTVDLGGKEYKDVYSYSANGQASSLVRLTDTLLSKNLAGNWLVFDIYVDLSNARDTSNTNIIFRYNGANALYAYTNTTGVLSCEGYTIYAYSIDANGHSAAMTGNIGEATCGKWARFAIQFNDVAFTEVSWFVNSNPSNHYLKNIYLTTEELFYIEASGFDTSKTYTAGDTINLTATAYRDGDVWENATNKFSVEGGATLDGNVLTVRGGEIKITVTNSDITNYSVSRTYTIQAYTWSNLAVTGIDESKTYAYNDIVELSATAVKEGDLQAQAVNASYEVASGSAVVWQDSQGKWYAKPGVGDSEITASFGGDEVTFIFKGDADTIMFLGGATEQGYESDALLSNYFKEVTTDGAPYTYEMYNGRYAVNYHYADWQNGFALKDTYKELADIDGWLYIDMYYERQALTYFFINGNEYLYFFSSYNSESITSNQETMQKTSWQWYDMDGTPYTTAFNDNHVGRWMTLEIALKDVGTNANLVLSKFPSQVTKNMYISSVVVSKTRLITAKQEANAQVLNILDDEAAFENYWTPAGAYSQFTWTTMAGRNALQYKSLANNCSALQLDTVYKTSGYDMLLPKYNYVYLDFYVEAGKSWDNLTVITEFASKNPYYLTQYANTAAYNAGRSALEGTEVNLGFDYQWYVTNSDGELEALTSAPTSKTGVWVTLELCIPTTLASYDISIEKYPNDTSEANQYGTDKLDDDLYISNVRLSKKSLAGIVAQ